MSVKSKEGEKEEEETPGESKKRMTKKRKIVSKKAAARALLVEREGRRRETLEEFGNFTKKDQRGRRVRERKKGETTKGVKVK